MHNFNRFKNLLLTTLFVLSFTLSLSANQKPLAPQDCARENLLMLFAGEWVSRGLYVATKLEIADLLTSPKSIEELALLTDSNADSLSRLMHLLAGFGVFEEVSEGVYANTVSSQMLSKTHPETLHSLSLFYGEDIHKSWDNLLASIKEGTPAFNLTYKQPVFSFFKENPSSAALFQEAMKEKTKAVVQSTLSSYNFSHIETVYDIGGGYGQFMQALLNKNANLSGLLFELPEVIEKIKMSQIPQDPRLKLYAGDFFKSIPKGGDRYLLKSVLHDWDDSKAELILKNCHEAMNDQSRLLIIEVVLQPKDQSIYANCMDLLMLTITGGKERTLSSFNEMFERTGFVLEKIYPTTTEFSILEARKK